MAKKSVGRLAGLAALGAAAYMMSRGKDAKGPSATADEEKLSKARTAAQKDAVSGDRAAKDENYSNEGYKKPEIKNEPKSAPVVKREVKSEVIKDNKPAQVDKVDRNENYSNEGRYKPEIKTEDKPLYKQEGVTIGGVEKRTEGNKPMPSLKQVESKAAARKASISTDEMKNRSRAQAAHIAKMKRLKANPESQAAEPVYPEQFITPGGSVKTIAGMAKNLASRNTANKGEGVLSAAGQRLKDTKDFVRGGYPGRDAAVTNPMAWAGGPKTMEKIAQAEGRAAAAETRAAAAEARAAAAQAKRDAKDPFMNFKPGSDFKRGGAVKMTASRRGDGIATRGKTKCKMY